MIYNAKYAGLAKDILPLQTKVQFASPTHNPLSQDCTTAVYTNRNSTLSCQFYWGAATRAMLPILALSLTPKILPVQATTKFALLLEPTLIV
jgi:hypothetical protein